MKIIKSDIEFITPINRKVILERLEQIGRVCYKSEDKIKEGTASKFIGAIVKAGHESVIEHCNLTVKVVTNRGVTHEIVRHRIASYSQESSRYCNYSKGKFGNELKYIDIREGFPELSTKSFNTWQSSCINGEIMYLKMIDEGCTPDIARSLLNNSIATEIVMTMNLREWRHFLKIRTEKVAHPEIRVVANKILNVFKIELPEIFGDIVGE